MALLRCGGNNAYKKVYEFSVTHASGFAPVEIVMTDLENGTAVSKAFDIFGNASFSDSYITASATNANQQISVSITLNKDAFVMTSTSNDQAVSVTASNYSANQVFTLSVGTVKSYKNTMYFKN